MLKKYILLLVFLSGCVSYSNMYDEMKQDMRGSGQPENISPCQYENIDEKEIILETKSEVPQKGDFGEFGQQVTATSFGYSSLKVTPSPGADHIPYEPYQNMEGKIIKEISVRNDPYNTIGRVAQLTKSYYKIVLNNCDVVYVNTGMKNFEYANKEVYEQALEFKGTTVWADRRENIYNLSELFGAETELDHIEEVEVVDVLPSTFLDSNVFISHAIFEVKNHDGDVAYLPYNRNYFFVEDPIKDEWSESHISRIKNQSYIIGMTPYQIMLSLGSPNDINRSVGEWGQHEQWVYGSTGSRFYLYFEDGVLTSYQD